MGRIERNGDCKTCGGRIRFYPAANQLDQSSVARWTHLNREDWITNPHEAAPTDDTLAAAGLVAE